MNTFDHAMLEFRAAGWLDDDGNYIDEMQEAICKHVLKLLDVFADEGHSGSTAPYAVNLFKTLAMYEPVVPLTGEDWEWTDVRESGDGTILYQNKRCGHVFKDGDGQAYDIDGKVFWEWCRYPLSEGEEGYPGLCEPFKSYYTSGESRVYVTFPYKPERQYVWKWSGADPLTPKQTEEGFVNDD